MKKEKLSTWPFGEEAKLMRLTLVGTFVDSILHSVFQEASTAWEAS